MYDTIKLWLPVKSIVELDYLNRVPTLLNNVTQHTKEEAQYITGSFNGLNTTISNKGISFHGSIAKFYLKDNIQTLTRQDTQRAIEMISDTLILPVNEAIVSRADVSHNFLMDYEPEQYYPMLGESTRYKRLLQPKSVYYSQGLRTKLFYNKVAEVKSKRVIIPEIWEGKNVLRYELRFTSRLPQQFNCYQVQAKNLYEEGFYINIIDRWLNEYEAINKLKEINLNFEKMNKPKDFFNQMALLMINEIGQNEALKLVDKLKANNCFEHKEYYSRVKADIKRLCKTYEPEQANCLITELNKKVRQVKEHYR